MLDKYIKFIQHPAHSWEGREVAVQFLMGELRQIASGAPYHPGESSQGP